MPGRIGIICEGHHSDAPALKLLLEAEFGGRVEPEIVPTTKKVIFEAPHILLRRFPAAEFDHVVVCWDLHPIGIQMAVPSQVEHDKPCQNEQRKRLLTAIAESDSEYSGSARGLLLRYGMTGGARAQGPARISLTCFCASFDAVFLADPVVLRKTASSDKRQAATFPNVASIEAERSPEVRISRYFKSGHNKRLRFFNKAQHNVVLAQSYVDLGRIRALRRHSGYSRLVQILERFT